MAKTHGEYFASSIPAHSFVGTVKLMSTLGSNK